MLPRDLKAEQFAGYPPQARALMVAHLGALQQLPLSFVPSLLREVIDYDYKFPAERAAIDYAAERAGLKPGSYARRMILGQPMPREARSRHVNGPELARILGELGKIGSNLNQLAKDANSGVVVYHGEILRCLGGLHVLKDQILAALGRAP